MSDVKAVLEMDGWKKTILVDDHLAKRGFIEVEFTPPVNLMGNYKDVVPKIWPPVIRFYHNGHFDGPEQIAIYSYDIGK